MRGVSFNFDWICPVGEGVLRRRARHQDDLRGCHRHAEVQEGVGHSGPPRNNRLYSAGSCFYYYIFKFLFKYKEFNCTFCHPIPLHFGLVLCFFSTVHTAGK
jgi:hypothetical protein